MRSEIFLVSVVAASLWMVPSRSCRGHHCPSSWENHASPLAYDHRHPHHVCCCRLYKVHPPPSSWHHHHLYYDQTHPTLLLPHVHDHCNTHLFVSYHRTFCQDCRIVWDPCCNSHRVDCTSHLLHDDDRGIDRSSVCCRIRSLSSQLHVDTAVVVVVVDYAHCLEEDLETEERPLPQQRPLLSLALHEPLQWPLSRPRHDEPPPSQSRSSPGLPEHVEPQETLPAVSRERAASPPSSSPPRPSECHSDSSPRPTSNSTTRPRTRPLPSRPESRPGPTAPVAGPPPSLLLPRPRPRRRARRDEPPCCSRSRPRSPECPPPSFRSSVGARRGGVWRCCIFGRSWGGRWWSGVVFGGRVGRRWRRFP
mmetsp:Transcript_7099/g.15655  ORF Transcript_7099/g.15655 Transcript_7099/m.15655 type:complete len:364 (+) Transcript_7099:725-1816(+)